MNFNTITAVAGGILFSIVISSIVTYICWSVLALADIIHHPSLREVVAVGITILFSMLFLSTSTQQGVLQAMEAHEKNKEKKVKELLDLLAKKELPDE